jgi:hypothetical protein
LFFLSLFELCLALAGEEDGGGNACGVHAGRRLVEMAVFSNQFIVTLASNFMAFTHTLKPQAQLNIDP